MLFISYAREDRTTAARLIHELDADGIDFIIDPELTQGDPFWRDLILEQFEQCDLMVGIASASAEASPWVEQEQRAFAGRKLWIALDGREDEGHVPTGKALAAIRSALPPSRLAGEPRPRQHPSEAAERRAMRLRWMNEQQERHEAFVRSLEPSRARDRSHVSLAPVTNAQFGTFIAETGFAAPPPTWERSAFRADDAPVTGVDWFEASAFAAWAGGCLPTERQWLEAALGGEAGRRFATADGDIGPATARYGHTFAGSAPAPVHDYPSSPEGYYGLCGNTWDWCASEWGDHRAIRGGGYMDASAFCMVQARYRQAPIDRDCCVGFRIALPEGQSVQEEKP